MRVFLLHFEIFVNTGRYGAGDFRSEPNFMINKATIREYQVSLFGDLPKTNSFVTLIDIC